MEEKIYKNKQLVSIVKNFWNDINSSFTNQEIEDFIYESYKEDIISGEQYDILLYHLENGFE